MKDFNRGGGFGDKRGGGGGFGRRDSGGRGGFNRGGGDFGRPTMHKAVCSDCGASCELPFRPTGERPVFCSNCFKGKDESAPRRDDRHEHRSESRFDSRPEPRLESRDFAKPSSHNNFSNEQFETLNAKLDKILRALNSAPVNSQSNQAVKEKAEKVEKAEVKAEPVVKEVKKEAKKVVKKPVATKAKAVVKKKKK